MYTARIRRWLMPLAPLRETAFGMVCPDADIPPVIRLWLWRM